MIPTHLGLYSTQDLRRRGMGRGDLLRAVEAGLLWHVHRGWYAVPGTDAAAIRAMRLGGRLGCVSALRVHGAWTPPDQGLHLAMPPRASGRRSRGATASDVEPVTRHWHATVGEQTFDRGMSALPQAVAQAVMCQPVEMSVAILDSVIHRRLMTRPAVEALLLRLPRSRSHVLRLVDGRSEEGIESLARVALTLAGFDVTTQVVIEEVGRVDLIVDGWLVIELDGRETHAQQQAFVSDRRRAAALSARGYHLLVFPYSEVVYNLARLVDTVRRVVAQHGHVPAVATR